MIISAWNIRGFNKSVKHSEVAGFLAQSKVDFCGLLETRVKKGKADSILRKSFTAYNSFCNYNSHYNGRIWLIWHSATTQVTILEEYPQVVHCLLKHHATNRVFYVYVVYGSNNATERQGLWSNLSNFASTVGPWLVIGDFNVIRLDSGSAVYSKLDRVLINAAWSNAFTRTSAQFLPPGLSDHSPSLRFSFLNCWPDHPQFRSLVTEAWNHAVTDNPMFRLMGKLQNVKKELKKLHHHHFAGIKDKVQQRKEELADYYQIQKERQASSAYWKQRAKLHDLKYGDISSQYLYSKIKERHQAQVIGLHQHMLGSSIPVKAIDLSVISNGNMVEASDCASLIRPVSRAKIKLALFAIDSNKSSDIDGFSSGFFKAAWHILEDDFCCAIEDFFRTSFMSKQANASLVSLIPKKPVPQTVKDFRPISCCSVVYKTLSKILTSRLQGVMPKIVVRHSTPCSGTSFRACLLL
ncbi:hypothetical protein RND81_01G075300 [Saponaria officinalis]|uniref:Endonuclease/exonuclease/phosphatase domain-containing protein n=1 Tax=Saponaria officinalis TaxID=3572 RepID=A0AAW1N938_SAPOF